MKFLVAIIVLSSSVHSLAALENLDWLENGYSDSSWTLLSVELQKTDFSPSKLPVLKLRRSEECSAKPIAVSSLTGDNSAVILDLELKHGHFKTLAIMVEGKGIFVTQDLVSTVQSIFTQNVVIGGEQQKLEDLLRRMLQTAEVQKLDSIQVWLNAMSAPESNELFRTQIGDQIISLPFYEISSVELERLTRQSDLEFIYDTPHVQTQPLSLKPRMSPVKDQNPRGTCSVFAAVAMLEFYHPGHIFSEQCLAKFSSNEDPGSTKDRILYAVGYNYLWGQKIGGLYHSHDCPYNPNSRDQIPNLNGVAVFWPEGSFTYEHTNMNDPIGHIRRQISNGQPAAIEVYYAGNWNQEAAIQAPTDEEIQRTCKNIKLSTNLGKKLCAGHAIVVTGYDDRDSSFQFKNSWGKTRYWPEGYGKMSYAYYLKMRMDSFIISK